MERNPHNWVFDGAGYAHVDWDYWRQVVRSHRITQGWKEVWKDGQFQGWKESRSRWYGSSKRFMDVRIPWKEFRSFAIKYWSTNA